jgi:hypothetical protein
VETALHQPVVWVEKALDQQETALGVFLDVEGAFNNTSCDSKCGALFTHAVNYIIVQWIRATLEGHLAVANLHGYSKRVVVSRGCQQGGVLSPLLWCLVDDLIARLNGGGIYTQTMQITFVFQLWGNSQTLLGLIQWALHTVKTWCDKVGLWLILTKLGLLYSQVDGNSLVSLNHTFFELLYVTLCQSNITDSPGFSADLEGACGCQSKEGSQFVVGL